MMTKTTSSVSMLFTLLSFTVAVEQGSCGRIHSVTAPHRVLSSLSCSRRPPLDNAATTLVQTQDDVSIISSPLDKALHVRGGATKHAKSRPIALPETKENFLLQKLRNVIRSVLEVGERKSPTLTSLGRRLLRALERLTGVSLLPPPPRKRSDKTKKKKSKATSRLQQASDRDTTTMPKTKSHRKAKKSPGKTTTTKTTTTTTKSTPTKSTARHLQKEYSTKHSNYRIQKELKEFLKSPPPNLSVRVGSNIRVWIITLTGANNTIYEGEVYKLRVQFPPAYPTVPPSVYFLPPPPQHEHVYTNGDICLSLLGDGWRPTMTAQSIAVSILSILSSAQTKSLPMDNARHSQNKPGEYQKDWVYHDDNC